MTHIETFPRGTLVRYKPGTGTYGYEETTRRQPDGCIPSVVVGHTAKRVQIDMTLVDRVIRRAVDPASLRLVDAATV